MVVITRPRAHAGSSRMVQPRTSFEQPGMIHTCLYHIDLPTPATSAPSLQLFSCGLANVFSQNQATAKPWLPTQQAECSGLRSRPPLLLCLRWRQQEELPLPLPTATQTCAAPRAALQLAGEAANSPFPSGRASYCANQAQLPSVARVKGG